MRGAGKEGRVEGEKVDEVEEVVGAEDEEGR